MLLGGFLLFTIQEAVNLGRALCFNQRLIMVLNCLLSWERLLSCNYMKKRNSY